MKRNLRYVVILSFFVVVIFLGVFKIVNFDFGWHLKAGEYIYSSKSIPRHDVFSYIAQGNQWIDSHWLFQLVLYIFYALGGITGGIILRTLVVVLTFIFLFLTIYRKEYYPVSIVVGLFALFMSFQRFLLRPEIFSLFFLILFFYFTENFSKHPYLSLISIPICQVFWANMHGLHLLGIVFLFLYFLGDLVQTFLSKHISIIPKLPYKKSEWKQKSLLFGLTCMGILINANGKEGIIYPYKIFAELRTKPTIFSRITELVPPFSIKYAPFPDPSVVYKIFLILSVIVIICQLKHIRLAYLFLYGAFFYLSIKAIRNVPLFAMVAAPITIWGIYGILDFFLKNKKLPYLTSLLIGLLFIVLSSGICVFVANNGLYRRLHLLRTFGFGISEDYPIEAVQYLKNKNSEGNIFNSSDIGGYLIWQMYPQKQVALDGRWEVYGNFLANLQELKNPLYFNELAGLYNIKTIILYKRSWEIHLMAPWLKISPFWQVAKETPQAVVYEKINY